MLRKINRKSIEIFITGALLVAYFLFFALFNRYHINYQEQNQLFLWNLDFIKDQFSLPGGLVLYAGSFFTQFFVYSWLGAFIFTINAFAVFLLSSYIQKKHGFNNIIISFIPVWLLTILQSNELFIFSQALGFLALLSFCALYISIDKTRIRYILFFAGWPLLYILAGGFSIPAVILCVLHELLFRKEDRKYLISFLFLITGLLIPFLSSKLIYYIQPDKIFTYPLILELPSFYLYSLIIFLIWAPLALIISYLVNLRIKVKNSLLSWNLTNVFAGALIIVAMTFVISRYAYNKNADMMFGIDHHVQQSEWEKVLNLSERYPGYNTLVIYYTNIALYKSGQLFDKMFFYPQIGSRGLRLPWARNLNLFFGGELFYQMSYNSESIHWAFEALVAKGLNPRSLKRLAAGFIVNGHYDIAEKYIAILDQTLFYRKWAKKYQRYVDDPALCKNDPELKRHINLKTKSNYFSEVTGMNLPDLLSDHPQNKMAYHYLVASLLLDKNLEGFANAIMSIGNYGYKRLPLHIQEALLFYNFYEHKDVIPEGFSISPEVITRFDDYATTYTRFRTDRAAASYALKEKHANTYWYYLQFINN